MAVSRHLGYYRTGNSTLWSDDPENPSLGPNMEWIGCTVCEIFALICDLETGVRGHSRSSKVAPFDRTHTTLYLSSIVTMPLSLTVSEISPHIGGKSLPPCIWRLRWGWSRQIYATTLGFKKLEWWAYQMVKEFQWYVQPFWYNTRLHVCDGQTELAWHYMRYSIYATHLPSGSAIVNTLIPVVTALL